MHVYVNRLGLSICPVCKYVCRVKGIGLNVGQCCITVKRNSRCPHLVGVRDRLPGR